MELQAKIIHSTSTNPWYNLALEEYLVKTVSNNAAMDKDIVILYLWQNDNTVVIGRNQNAWNECRTGLLEEDGGMLARRSTGGGAVFHDMGNLNFSIITPKKMYDIQKSLGLIVKAVQFAGIDANLSGRNDILADDRKFSGNAFLVSQEAGLHHGTLLINSDYARIGKYLNVKREKLESKGVKSVQSRVVNLASIRDDLSVAIMKRHLETAFVKTYSPRYLSIDYFDNENNIQDFDVIHNKYKSWEWRYGESIGFTIDISQYFPWGHLEMCFKVDNGLIAEAGVFTDALDSEYFTKLTSGLTGIRFTSDSIIKIIQDTNESEAIKALGSYNIKDDICGFVKSAEF